MGVTKTNIFSDELNDTAQLFKVLGHPARLAILQYIIDKKTCICTELVTELGLAQATISQHLNELKNVNLLKGTIEGKSICYCINESVWENTKNKINQFLTQPIINNNCC